MRTFTINSCDEAERFSQLLNRFCKVNNLGSGLPKDYLQRLYKICQTHENGDRIFNAIVDLELNFVFMAKNFFQSAGIWNERFSPGKLKGGSILEDFMKFQGKLNILEGLSSFSFRSRAFWDKYMGILVLIYSPTNYDKFSKAKSRKKKFKSLASEWNNFSNSIQNSLIQTMQGSINYNELKEIHAKGRLFPYPFLDIFFSIIDHLDNQYRTPEAHGTGSIRKWSLSMLPLEYSKDFALTRHWNIGNSMIKGFRKFFLSDELECWEK